MATHSSTLAWRGGLHPMGSQRVTLDWSNFHFLLPTCLWGRPCTKQQLHSFHTLVLVTCFTCLYLFVVAELRLTLWDPMDRSPPGSFVHRILQARILEWVTISSSRVSSRCGDRTCIYRFSGIGRQILYHWATWEAHNTNSSEFVHFLPQWSLNDIIRVGTCFTHSIDASAEAPNGGYLAGWCSMNICCLHENLYYTSQYDPNYTHTISICSLHASLKTSPHLPWSNWPCHELWPY